MSEIHLHVIVHFDKRQKGLDGRLNNELSKLYYSLSIYFVCTYDK